MKKLLLILAFLAVSASLIVRAWALPDNIVPSEYSGSQSLKQTGGVVYGVNVNYIGVTAGDKVQLIDGGAGGTVRFTCVASAANGSCPSNYTAGAMFTTNIYLKETKTGGNFYTDIQIF